MNSRHRRCDGTVATETCSASDTGARMMPMTSHTDVVVDQFTRQATPFANSAAMRDEEALRLLVAFSGATADDTVLDVACGPGLVVAAFAKVVQQASGIDLTPAMI